MPFQKLQQKNINCNLSKSGVEIGINIGVGANDAYDGAVHQSILESPWIPPFYNEDEQIIIVFNYNNLTPQHNKL